MHGAVLEAGQDPGVPQTLPTRTDRRSVHGAVLEAGQDPGVPQALPIRTDRRLVRGAVLEATHHPIPSSFAVQVIILKILVLLMTWRRCSQM